MDTKYKIFRFRQFPVYNDARIFVQGIKILIKNKFPTHEQFSLTAQIHRALDSIILNIAEGSERGTDKDFAHFLNISNSSLYEVVACCDIALDSKYVTDSEHDEVLGGASILSRQLTAFRKSLLLKPTK